MSSRMASRAFRACSQTARMAERNIYRNMKSCHPMPEMKLKTTMKGTILEFMNKKANNFANMVRVNRSELARMQVGAVAMLLTTAGPMCLSLAELASFGLTSDEEEEGSSSGVRRRKGQ